MCTRTGSDKYNSVLGDYAAKEKSKTMRKKGLFLEFPARGPSSLNLAE